MNTKIAHLIFADDEPDFYTDAVAFQLTLPEREPARCNVQLSFASTYSEILTTVASSGNNPIFHVAVLDLHFPEPSDGLAIIEMIRQSKDRKVKTMLIYVCSLNVDQDYINMAYERGANGYFDKAHFPDNIFKVACGLLTSECYKPPVF